MARKKKSPVSSLVIVGLALLMFIAAVGIGVSMLGKNDDKPDDTSSESSEDVPVFVPSESEPVSSESESVSSESEEAKPSEEVKPSEEAAPSQSAPAESKPAESKPAESKPVQPETIDTSDSGFSNIPNFKKINSDVKGWIKIPGTNINYPVLYDSAPNHYYLTHDINKQPSHDAVIYADPASSFGTRDKISTNTILYGHNWTNWTAQPRIGHHDDIMFAQLTAYQYLDFAKQHPYIYYSTESEEMVWQVFATFYTDINFIYNYAEPSSTSAYQNIINGAKARSRNTFDVPVSTNDKILTLSTCTRAYGKSDKQRFVVMAKLMPKGAALNPVSVSANPNPVLPSMSVLFPGK